MSLHHHAPALRGGLLALLAAVLFGPSTPPVQKLGAGVGVFSTAGLSLAGRNRPLCPDQAVANTSVSTSLLPWAL
jgi:hypothetical protein